MNKTCLLLFLLAAPASPAAAAAPADCPKETEACSAAPAPASPFLKASLRQAEPPAAKKAPAAKPAPAAAPAVSTAAPAPAAGTPAPGRPSPLSSPLWLLFVAGVLAGLYFYLSGGKKGKRR